MDTSVCTSLAQAMDPKTDPRRYVSGLTSPLESNTLFLVDQKGRLVLAKGMRESSEEKLTEWALITGKANTIIHGQSFTYSDKLFIKPNNENSEQQWKRISDEECQTCVFENPRSALAREFLEEITGTEELTQDLWDQLDWLVKKIYNSTEWTFVTTSKDAKIKVTADQEVKIQKFSTLMGLCRVVLTDGEIQKLNTQIGTYEDTEYWHIEPKEWRITETKNEKDGKIVTKKRLEVNTGDEFQVRKYFKDIMFVFYWDQISKLINNSA